MYLIAMLAYLLKSKDGNKMSLNKTYRNFSFLSADGFSSTLQVHSSKKGEWGDPHALSHYCALAFPSSPVSQKPIALSHKAIFFFLLLQELKLFFTKV